MSDDNSKTSVWFYHLLHSPLMSALPALLEKTLARKMKAKILFENEEHLNDVDMRLWSEKPESWIPHAKNSEKHAEENPIILSLDDDRNENNAQFLFLLKGVGSKNMEKYSRVFIVFDSKDKLQLEKARKHWVEYKKAGFNLEYYQQTANQSWKKQK